MVLRVRKEVNYAEVAEDDPKQRPKVPRIDNPAGAHRRPAATVDPDTKLENLDSKYANDLDARNRAIRSVVRTRSLPAPFLCFLERRRRRRRRTAVRVSLAMTTRAPDAFICFARRRRCGTPTRRNGSRSRASRGGSSARSSARRARPRQRLLPPRASAGRWPSTNASRSARRAALRARRATTSRTPSRWRRRRRPPCRRPPCLPREVVGAGVGASPVRRRTRRASREPRVLSRRGSPWSAPGATRRRRAGGPAARLIRKNRSAWSATTARYASLSDPSRQRFVFSALFPGSSLTHTPCTCTGRRLSRQLRPLRDPRC